MKDNVKDYIKQSLKEESDIWLGIAKEKTVQYPDESPRQIIIRTIIQHFETKFPVLMSELDNEIKKKRERAKNEHSSNDTTDLRQVTAIPDGLDTRINQAFEQHKWPRFLSKEAQEQYQELDWFIKEFPRFKIPLIY